LSKGVEAKEVTVYPCLSVSKKRGGLVLYSLIKKTADIRVAREKGTICRPAAAVLGKGAITWSKVAAFHVGKGLFTMVSGWYRSDPVF